MVENKTKLSIKIISATLFSLPLLFLSPRNITPATVAYAAQPAVPLHLTIANAKVDTNIIQVGVTKKGNLDVPNNYSEVGWYKNGPKPGEEGSVVLDGHVDNGSTTPGPFKHLKNLTTGDTISITMSDGSKLKYGVTDATVYETNKFPSKKVFGEKDRKYLKLITCHGNFVPSLNTYDHRLVVTAVLL